MAYWLMKTEPDEFGFGDLERVGREPWNGVRNATALRHMRQMRRGDLVLIYHTGNEKAVIGIAEVAAEAYPDPTEADPRFVVVDVALRQRLPRPVTLSEIKADPQFADWELVRISRLSVMPVSDQHWQAILGMGGLS